MTDVGAKGDLAEPTAIEKKIARQIEYYFGDANLKRDRFLQLQIREDDGWVPLEIMVRFNRLKALTTDYEQIVAALEKSDRNLMEVSEDKQKIRRSPSMPLPEETASYWQGVRSRSVYCKGFSVDEQLDDIQEFMEQFGETVHIQMKRDKERKFKGSIYVVYNTEEGAKTFLDSKDVRHNDKEMIKMSKEDYFKMKTEERKQKRDDEKKKKQEEKDQEEKSQIEAMQGEFDDYEKGCILFFSGANDQTSREDLKEIFSDHGTIQWVDFSRGQTEGTVRFTEEVKAQEALDKAKAANDGPLQVRGCELTFRVLEGEEEEEHWKKVFADKSMARVKKQAGRRGRRNKGGFQKPYGNRRDRDRRDSREKPQGKKTVFESDEEGEEEEKKPEEKAVKRPAEDNGSEEQSPKKAKTDENDS